MPGKDTFYRLQFEDIVVIPACNFGLIGASSSPAERGNVCEERETERGKTVLIYSLIACPHIKLPSCIIL